MLTTFQRTEAIRHAQFLIDWKVSVGYGDSRPVPWIGESLNGMLTRFKAGEVWEPDCSGAVEWICKWSGWKTPTIYPFGLGGSADMFQHLTHRYTDPRNAHAGALVTYGDAGEIHVCMVMQPDGTNPWLFSHGSDAGPLHIRLSDENRAHAGQAVTFLDVSGL
jgi:hypothetical protein